MKNICADELIKNSRAVILAGGKSSRMGGFPKGLLEYGGRAFCALTADMLSDFRRIYISANDDRYARFGYEIIPDVFAEKGPLGGILSALEKAGTEYVFFAPCDMPFLTDDTVKKLARKVCESGCDAAVAECCGKIYPTLGFYSSRCLPVIEKNILQGRLKLTETLNEFNTEYVSADSLMNINTRADYDALVKEE